MPSITDSIGRVLGDRYRLVTALGTGASAHVYLADDVSLHRRVAIKVLHPALAGDSAFLKRFRAEAQAVAALNHPNILQVYDWGEEDGEPYLVLEYLAGGSLRQVYDTGALLSPEQAVQVGSRGGRRPRLRPPPRAGPPGHQAGQPALRRRPAPADRRLRSGPGPGRGIVDRAGRGHPGHRPLLRPRAGRGVGARREGRRLRPGPGALRGGDRRGALHRRHHRGHPDGPGGRAAARARGPGPAQRRAGVGGRPRARPSATTPPSSALRLRGPGRRPAPPRARCPWSTTVPDDAVGRAGRVLAPAGGRTAPGRRRPRPHRAGCRPDAVGRAGAERQAAPDGQGTRPGTAAATPVAVDHRRRGRRRPGRRRCGPGRPKTRSSPPAIRSPRWWASRWPRPTGPWPRTSSPCAPTGHAYSLTLGAGLILSQHPAARAGRRSRSPPSRARPSTWWSRPARRR